MTFPLSNQCLSLVYSSPYLFLIKIKNSSKTRVDYDSLLSMTVGLNFHKPDSVILLALNNKLNIRCHKKRILHNVGVKNKHIAGYKDQILRLQFLNKNNSYKELMNHERRKENGLLSRLYLGNPYIIKKTSRMPRVKYHTDNP